MNNTDINVDRRLIVLVDDSPAQVLEITVSLEKAGYEVKTFADGPATLDYLLDKNEKTPLCVISDINMPKMDGYSLCKAIKDNPEFSIPVLLATTLTENDCVFRSLEAKADGFITKPYSPTEVSQWVNCVDCASRIDNPYKISYDAKSEEIVVIPHANEEFHISAGKERILSFLMNAYQAAIDKNVELNNMQKKLKEFNNSLVSEVAKQTKEINESLGIISEGKHEWEVTLDSLNELVILVSENGKILRANRTIETWNLAELKKCKGRDLADIVPAACREQTDFFPQVEKKWAPDKAESICFEWEGFDSNLQKHLRVTVRRAGSRLEGRFVVVMEDRSEQKMAEIELDHQRELTRQSQKLESIGQLAGGVAHDFNNILTAIKGFSQLAIDSLDEQHQAKSDVREIQDAAIRAAELTNSLLAFSRKQVVQIERIDLNQALTDSVKILRPLISENILLKLNLPDEPTWTDCDKSLIEQIVMNLAINARDAMPEGGHIIIEAGKGHTAGHTAVDDDFDDSGEYSILSVTDSGQGMTKEVQNLVFEPFFTTKPVGHGTGMGLSMVYGSVNQMKGSISLYSEVNVGTTFRISLPLSPDEPCDMVTKDSGGLPSSSVEGNETVLLIEDDDMVRAVTKRILSSAGFHILEAANANDAEQIWEKQKHSIQLLITDIVMPGKLGFDIAAEFCEQRPELPVIFITGYTGSAVSQRWNLDRDLNFLQKPFTRENLLGKVRKALDEGVSAT